MNNLTNQLLQLLISLVKLLISLAQEHTDYVNIKSRVELQKLEVWDDGDILKYQSKLRKSSLEKISSDLLKSYKPTGGAKYFKPSEVISFLTSNKQKGKKTKDKTDSFLAIRSRQRKGAA